MCVEGCNQDLDISKVGTRVMDELVQPMNEIQINDTEFACLKAILFFDQCKCIRPRDRKLRRKNGQEHARMRTDAARKE